MTASDPHHANGMPMQSFDDMIAETREACMRGISDLLDTALQRFVIPADRVALLLDMGPFACFMVALKIAEVQTPADAQIDKRDGLRAWHRLGKTIDKDVPSMLLEWGREAAARQLQGSGESVDAQG